MKSRVVPIIACLIALVPVTESFGQIYGGSGLVSTNSLRRMGLNREWFVQVRVSSLRGGLGHLTQHVSSTEAETLFEVKYEEGIDRFTERELNAFGKPIGKVEAKKKADARANVLKADGFKPLVTERVIPEIRLYATTTRAMLHAIDGRTGATQWAIPLGNPDYPTEAPGANDSYVSAINGTHIALFDKRDGRQLWRRQTVGVPGAGPAVNDFYVFAPMLSGRVEAYPTDDDHQPPKIYSSTGRAIHQPVATNESISWSTDEGHMYVGRGSEKGVRFRLETQRQVSATPTILPNEQIIAASLDGYVYSLHELSGDIIWRFSTGEAIERTPVVIGEAVYVITERGGMFKLNLETGERIWWAPGIEQFLSASKTRLYCVSTRRELISIDITSGGRLGSVRLTGQDLLVTNDTTDRIYLATSSGLVQCLREDLPEYKVPYYHKGIGVEGKQRQEVIRETDPAADPKEADAAGDDPFQPPANDDPNPFAPKPAADDANPFGTPPANDDPNPFGTPPADDDANPFGSDPFGGN